MTLTRRRLNQAGRYFADSYTRRFPKVIEGALDLMPSGPPWDREEYEEWLAYLDQACRIYYRIPRSTPASETEG